MRPPFRFASILAAALALAIARPSAAQWVPDGLPVSTAFDYQYSPHAVPDGEGGAIIVWLDRRNGPTQLYAQRLTPAGLLLWTPQGVAVDLAFATHWDPKAVADGQGGAIVVWEDARGDDDDIYAQRIDAQGHLVWGPDAVGACVAPGQQDEPIVASDGAGGAIILWNDYRAGWDGDLYAQHVDALGSVRWDSSGVALATGPAGQSEPAISMDGVGGAIVSWSEYSGSQYDLRAQRVRSGGSLAWPAGGIVVCAAAGDQNESVLVRDADGGAIVAWSDRRGGTGSAMFAQRVSSEGALLWPDSLALGASATNSSKPCATRDGSGGAIVAWQALVGGQYLAMAQRVDPTGQLRYDPAGRRLTISGGSESNLAIASDGVGGAIVAWVDSRLGGSDIWAQRIDGSGTRLWPDSGLAVSATPQVQNSVAVAPGLQGGAIVTWADFRASNYDIYANLAGSGAVATGVAPAPALLESYRVVPNPARSQTAIEFELREPQHLVVGIHDVSGRLVRSLVDRAYPAGRHVLRWDGTNQQGVRAAAGVYFIRVAGSQAVSTRRVELLR